MAEDVWSALVQGVLAFAHSRAGVLTGTTFKDSEALVGALAADPTVQGVAKARLEQLKTDIKNLSDVGKKIADAIKPQVDQATKAVQDMGTELGKSPFTW